MQVRTQVYISQIYKKQKKKHMSPNKLLYPALGINLWHQIKNL